MTDPEAALAAALAAIEADDATLYVAVREAWRAWRCAELATLLERLAATAHRAVGAYRPKVFEAAWQERIAQAHEVELPGLVHELAATATPSLAGLVGRCVRALGMRGDDPALATALLALLDIRGDSAWSAVHTTVLAGLAAAADPRSVERLTAIMDAAEADDRLPARRASLRRADATIAAIEAHCPAGVPASPATWVDALAQLAVRVERPPAERRPLPVREAATTDALLAAVWEQPDDDGLRLVCADALVERGDPRGTLIALQLGKAPRGLHDLLRDHGKALLGPLEPFVVRSSARFERGFLHACETKRIPTAEEAVAAFARPAWATVERITFHGHVRLTAAMRSLRVARGVTDEAVRTMAVPLPRVTMLGLTDFVPGKGGDRLAREAWFPGLRRLELPADAPHAWVFAAPFLPHLEALQVRLHPAEAEAVRDWYDLVAQGVLPRVDVQLRIDIDYMGELTFARTGPAVTGSVHVGIERALDRYLPAIERLLPAGCLVTR